MEPVPALDQKRLRVLAVEYLVVDDYRNEMALAEINGSHVYMYILYIIYRYIDH